MRLSRVTSWLHFYPRPPGGGRRRRLAKTAPNRFYFYPRPPGGGRPVLHERLRRTHKYFYPRPPGGGRPRPAAAASRPPDFYPRPPGGGRRRSFRILAVLVGISIHALRVEGDQQAGEIVRIVLISIHALRVEGDRRACAGRALPRHFYPRPPGGGRQQKRTKFSSVFAQKGEEFASLRRGKRKFAGSVLKRTNFGL